LPTECASESAATDAEGVATLVESASPASDSIRPSETSLLLAAVVCFLWTIFVGWPVLIFHVINNHLTARDHVHAAFLVVFSEVLVFWLTERMFRRHLAKRPPTPPVSPPYVEHPVPIPSPPVRVRARPLKLPAGLLACLLWTGLVGVPVLWHHANNRQLTGGEHVHSAVLFALSQAMVYWLARRWQRRIAEKAKKASAESPSPETQQRS
jgi:positive regulator of sigma E activity